MAAIEQLLGRVSDFVWGWPLLVLLVGTHVFLTFRLGFIQRHLWTAIKLSLHREKEGAGDVSQFGALTTALAATIGTGNIVGVATAVAAGGPGAVLWMWLTGVFGIATKYSEALLSVRFRVKNADGDDGRRADVRPRAGDEREVARRDLRRAHRRRRLRHREHGPGELHRRPRAGDVRHLAVGQRRAHDAPDRRRHPRRHPVDRPGLRAPRPVHGASSTSSAASTSSSRTPRPSRPPSA